MSPEQIQLSDVKFLVVDEADTMFDRSFEEATASIVRTVKVEQCFVHLNACRIPCVVISFV